MKTSEILADARDHVMRGWCKHVSVDGQGNVCAVGAIAWAEKLAGIVDPTIRYELKIYPYSALMRAVEEFGDYGSVPAFNDDARTTKADVLNAFDKAIIQLEEQGL